MIIIKIIHNIKILGIVIAIGLFFAGLNRIIDSYIPNDFKWGGILCLVSIIILLIDDGYISELDGSLTRNIAAINNIEKQ
tara:strand:+ start:8631 stop:8870 length:240 start_codon:yes stop_codon:yes gene_type:complete